MAVVSDGPYADAYLHYKITKPTVVPREQQARGRQDIFQLTTTTGAGRYVRVPWVPGYRRR